MLSVFMRLAQREQHSCANIHQLWIAGLILQIERILGSFGYL